jgi:hypothetical protein
MAGLLPAEGEIVIANLLFAGSSADRGTSLELGLFTNSSISNSITHATLTEPTGGDYARKTLANASWTPGSTSTYAKQTFTPIGTAYTGAIYGYFICTGGTGYTNKRIIAIELDPNGPFTLNVSDTYDVTPSITIS